MGSKRIYAEGYNVKIRQNTHVPMSKFTFNQIMITSKLAARVYLRVLIPQIIRNTIFLSIYRWKGLFINHAKPKQISEVFTAEKDKVFFKRPIISI